MTPRTAYEGPALFSYGFRPFFLSAILFALIVVPVWWLVWKGDVGLGGPFVPTDWHVHEMIFGYSAAVVTGFLFTAVPNWTGRLPTRGLSLAVLLALWAAGRLAVAGLTPFGPVGVAFTDQIFLLSVAAMIAREIIAGKNWRNLKVLVPVSLLWLANILFHVEAATQGSAGFARRLSIALVIFLVMLIGGRIVPSFTRNWLVQRGAVRLPVAFNRFDMACMAGGAVALFFWVAVPNSLACAFLSAVAALLHLVRLGRWGGHATWRSPLLVMLHLSYLMVPFGFASVSGAAIGLVNPAVPAHVFGIGVIGGMTVAVMMRATMGHTGRALVAGPVLTIAFALVFLATFARVAGQGISVGAYDGIDLAAALWAVSFALLIWRMVPWLTRPKAARKAASRLS